MSACKAPCHSGFERCFIIKVYFYLLYSTDVFLLLILTVCLMKVETFQEGGYLSENTSYLAFTAQETLSINCIVDNVRFRY